MDWDRQPVLIGVGQECWRDRDSSRTPVDALQAVLTRAASDTGSEKVLAAIDTMVHVPFIMNQIAEMAPAMPRNPGAVVAERLGIDAVQYTADVGGNLPQQLLNEFAARLVSGKAGVVALSGVELLASFLGAVRAGQGFPDWASGREDEARMVGSTPSMTAPTEQRHGLYEPINTYPIFESALAHADGLDVAAHQSRLGKLVSAMSTVAANNPLAWKQQAVSPEDALSTENGNRMVTYPYTKVMNAILAVDQAAAVIITTVGRARELGVDSERWIYLRGAASAHDPWHVGERESLCDSPALAAAARASFAQSGLGLDELTHFDLYSCFPSAVQVACRALGLSLDDPRGVTVTGGLTLFGGPGNNYSLHAIAEMVMRLRETTNGAGLVSANGGYLTKHSVGIYARDRGATPWLPGDDQALQRTVDDRAYPVLTDEGRGRMRIEGHAVQFDGGEPSRAIIVGRLDTDERCVANSQSPDVLERMTQQNCVDQFGTVSHDEGIHTFSF